MPVSISFQKNLTIDGKNHNEIRSISAKGAIKLSPSIASAKAGTLTVRTSDTAGTFNGTAHGFVGAERVDIYWDGGSRRGATVGVVAGDDVPFSGGAGDILPIATTPLTIMQAGFFDFRFDGDDLRALAAHGDAKCTIVLTGDDGVEDYAFVFPNAGQTDGWYTGSGVVNPVAGDSITRAYMTHGDSGGAKVISVSAAVEAP